MMLSVAGIERERERERVLTFVIDYQWSQPKSVSAGERLSEAKTERWEREAATATEREGMRLRVTEREGMRVRDGARVRVRVIVRVRLRVGGNESETVVSVF